MKNNLQKSGAKKSIRTKIRTRVLVLVMTVLAVLGGISCYLNYSSTNSTLKQTMQEAAKLTAERVQWEITAYKNVARDLGTIARMTNEKYTVEEKQEIIDQKVEQYGLVRGKMISPDGIAYIDGTDYSDREYFKRSMQGEVCVTEPMIAKTSGQLSIIISAPVWKDGIADTEVAGVVFLVPKETFLNEIVESVHVSQGGSSYILDAGGNTIAHQDMELVTGQSNTAEEAKGDPSLEALAALEKRMVAGEAGFGTYTYGGVKKLLAFAPVSGTDGWSLAINAPTSDFMKETFIGIGITVGIILLSLLVSLQITYKLAKEIGGPISLCARRLELLAQGDLHSEVPAVTAKDETGVLAEATRDIVMNQNAVINDIKHVLGSMSDNDFTAEPLAADSYAGDYAEILTSMSGIRESLNSAMRQIRENAAQVSEGAKQMAEGAQNLADGATDQAGAVEELLAAISETATGMEESTEKAVSASKKAEQVGTEVKKSDALMGDMTAAMDRVSDASKEIQNIIQTIEEIASETNLLSLNASIEAARAGEAGRGFAVVADAISNLSKESADAVDQTRKLIETALSEIGNGNRIVGQTGQSLYAVNGQIKEIITEMRQIADTAEKQQESMRQINLGIEQISAVVGTNSSTAEESSAMSEELSAQAEAMSGAVGRFKIEG